MSNEQNSKQKTDTITVTVTNAGQTGQTAEVEVKKNKEQTSKKEGDKSTKKGIDFGNMEPIDVEERNPSLGLLFEKFDVRQLIKQNAANGQDTLLKIKAEKIVENPNNPFKVRRDEEMLNMIESIQQFGILTPLLVRPLADDKFELVSGHRRIFAANTLKIEKIPCVVKEFTDDEAAIFMVDSNIQRENILPSEKAKAFKLKMDAIKRQGNRTDLTSCQVGTKSQDGRADSKIGSQVNESARNVARYIRLNELIPELLEMVDKKEIALNTAYEISFLSPELQKDLLEVIVEEETVPSLKQAQKLKKAAQEGKLNRDGISLVLQEERSTENKLVIKGDICAKYFSKEVTPKQREEIVVKALEMYFKKERSKKAREDAR